MEELKKIFATIFYAALFTSFTGALVLLIVELMYANPEITLNLIMFISFIFYLKLVYGMLTREQKKYYSGD